MKKNTEEDKEKQNQEEILHSFGQANMKCATATCISINEVETKCLIDTGAYTSFISEKFCAQRAFKRNKIQNRKCWVTANGTPISVTGQVTLNVKMGHKTIRAVFIVAEGLAQDVIIGVDILRPNGFIVNFKKGQLECDNEKIQINSIQCQSSQVLRSNANVSIAPFSQTTEWLQPELSSEWVLVSSISKKIHALEMVTSIQANGKLPIVITNPDTTSKHIKRGDPICKITETSIVCTIKNNEELTKFMEEETEDVEQVNAVYAEKYKKPWKPSEVVKFTNKNLTSKYRS